MEIKFLIGTSGWQYSDWQKNFYPKNLKKENWLSFYSKKFLTIEVNTCFYHLTKKTTFQKWKKITGKDFLFAIKLYRYFTHLKRLKINKEVLEILKITLDNISVLEKNLGPILIQLPPNLKFNEKLLKNFLENLFSLSKIFFKKSPLFSIELRNNSWFQEKTYKILKKYKVAFCISDSPKWETKVIKTTNWVYLRFHGKPILFSSLYSKKELKKWAKEIKVLKPKKAFVYFNNDNQGHAVKNAFDFKSLVNPARRDGLSNEVK